MLLQAVRSLYGEDFQWKPPPYEYEFEKLPIDLIMGNRHLREQLELKEPIDRLVSSWLDDMSQYRQTIEPFLIY